MMNRDFFSNVTEEFDERVRETLAALPEKRRRRMTARRPAKSPPRRESRSTTSGSPA